MDWACKVVYIQVRWGDMVGKRTNGVVASKIKPDGDVVSWSGHQARRTKERTPDSHVSIQELFLSLKFPQKCLDLFFLRCFKMSQNAWKKLDRHNSLQPRDVQKLGKKHPKSGEKYYSWLLRNLVFPTITQEKWFFHICLFWTRSKCPDNDILHNCRKMP